MSFIKGCVAQNVHVTATESNGACLAVAKNQTEPIGYVLGPGAHTAHFAITHDKAP